MKYEKLKQGHWGSSTTKRSDLALRVVRRENAAAWQGRSSKVDHRGDRRRGQGVSSRARSDRSVQACVRGDVKLEWCSRLTGLHEGLEIGGSLLIRETQRQPRGLP